MNLLYNIICLPFFFCKEPFRYTTTPIFKLITNFQEFIIAQKRSVIHSAFAMYTLFLYKFSLIKNNESPGVYAGFQAVYPTQ